MPRRSIYLDDIAHQSPIPNASRIGNIIAPVSFARHP